jgi:membrane-bound ClpP family serine protease
VRIEFTAGEFGKVRYTIQGEDDEVVSIASRVEERLEPMVQSGYSILANWRNQLGIAGLMATIGALGALLSLRLGAYPGVVVGIFIAILGFATTSILPTLFPRMVFCFGHGVDRYERLEKRRRLIGGVVCLGLVVSVVGGWIANRFFR